MGGTPDLDDSQRAAVEHQDGPLLVLAGPGTGKTRTIVERVARLIETEAATPESLLVLTFSRRAALEMRQRIHERLPISYTSFFIGTFHSLALSIITRHYRLLGYTDRPNLLTSEEQWARIARMTRAEPAEDWPTYAPLRHLRSFTQQVFDFILRAQEHLLTPTDVKDKAGAHNRPDWHEVADFMARYQHAIKKENFVDYGGMIADAVTVLRYSPDVRAALQAQYSHILVDEYQDTNPGQDELLRLLAGERNNLFVVGDPDQSIYAFRGATLENILNFERNHATLHLATNYRAAPKLVHASTTLIEHNVTTHIDRPLQAADPAKPGELFTFRFDHASAEIDFIATEAKRLHVDEGIAFKDMAVLVRSLRRAGAQLDGALTLKEVPHRILGGGIRLYDHPLIRPIITLLRLAYGEANDTDEITDTGDILAGALLDLDPLVVRALQREARLSKRTMLDVLEEKPSYIKLDDEARATIEDFLGLFDDLRESTKKTTIDKVVWKIWDVLPVFREIVATEDRPSIAAFREFYKQTVRFTERHPDPNVGQWLALTEAGDLGDDPWLLQHDDGADTLKVMTIHQAKGLEFDVVFVPGLVDGAFPNLSRTSSLYDAGIFSGAGAETRAQQKTSALEEERRVCYVALTRARTRAYLSATDDRRDALDAQVSRFLKDLTDAEPSTEMPRPNRRFLSLTEAENTFRRTLAAEGATDLEKTLALAGLRHLGNGGRRQWWGTLQPTRNPLPLYPDGLPSLSYSALSSYENCPQAFLYERELSLVRTEGFALDFGSLVHSVLERFLQLPEEGRTRERLLQIGDDLLEKADFRYRALAHQGRRKVREILENFMRLEYKPGGTSLPERPFEFEFDGVTIRGKIDRVDVEDDGLRLIDYKTGTSYLTKAAAAEDLQLAIYYLACHLDPSLAEMGRPKELVYLYVAQPLTRALKSVQQPVLPDHRERIEGRLRGLFDGLRAEAFDWSPHADCGLCGFKTVCLRWPQGGDLPL